MNALRSCSASVIVLFGHGSRDPLWRLPIEAVAERIRRADPQAVVCCAYLELTAPDLPSALRDHLAAGCTHVRIVPMFLGVGRHAREDLPALVETLRRDHPATVFDLRPAVGEDDRLLDLLALMASA